MDVTGYWYSFDYTEKTKFVPSFVPKFSRHTNENAIEIIHIKTLSSEPFFPFPDWFSGFKSAQIESALIDDAVNHITRGFQGKTIINVNNAGMVLEDEVEEMKAKVKEDYIGTKNGDGVIISLNDGPQDAIIIDTIEPRGRNEQFVTYDETAEFKLMAAHQAMNILFSRPGSSGFSSNADEIAMATDSLYLGTINPLREILLDDFNLIFKKINPNCEIDFVNFGQEKVIVSDVEAEVNSQSGENADDATVKAQAQLKGSVGGVQALLEIQNSFSAGTTTYDSAIAMLDLIFGYDKPTAIRLLGKPKLDEPLTPTENE
jgi:hypothetical protein